MTTIVAVASKEAIVMGTDSLGTESRRLIGLPDIAKYYDDSTKVVTIDLEDLLSESQMVPYNQLPNVSKLFPVPSLPMGIMFTGITSIGDRTIGGIIAELDGELRSIASGDYTVDDVATLILAHVRQRYEDEFELEPSPEWYDGPALRLLIGGYDSGESYQSNLLRIDVQDNRVIPVFSSGGHFGVALDGQIDWIQRILFGTDVATDEQFEQRTRDLLGRYYSYIQKAVDVAGVDFTVPAADTFGSDLELFNQWSPSGLEIGWADLSVQNAIECVDFLVDTVIKSQAVSSQLPTVGGDIHIAVIRKEDGFRFVSREEWKHRGHSTEIPRSDAQ